MLVARLGGSNPAEPITISFAAETSPDRGREDYVAISYDCQQMISQGDGPVHDYGLRSGTSPFQSIGVAGQCREMLRVLAWFDCALHFFNPKSLQPGNLAITSYIPSGSSIS
jgi:hypothetical protein